MSRAGAAAMQGRRRASAGGSPPMIAISGTVEIGETLTATYDGGATVQWLRDGVAIGGATSDTYAAQAADIGPEITCAATNGSGTTESNALVFDDAAEFPASAIGVSTAGLTTADAGTTVQSWAASLGAIACTLAAVASNNRPAYSASGGAGGRPLVTFDGTDDALDGVLTKGSAWADYEFGVVARQTADGDTSDRVITYGLGTAGSARFGINEQSSGVYRTSIASGANVSHTTAPTSALAHFSGDAAAGTINARTAGVVEGTSAGTVTSRADGESLYLGGLLLASGCTAMECMAWYCGPALTSTQRAHLRALLTYHTGVAC